MLPQWEAKGALGLQGRCRRDIPNCSLEEELEDGKGIQAEGAAHASAWRTHGLFPEVKRKSMRV